MVNQRSAKPGTESAPTRLRVLLVSDTHGQVDRRIAQLAVNCDLVVHAGDIGGSRVLELLRPASEKIFAVRGNNDTPQKWSFGERSALRALPECLVVDLPGGVLIATHGDQIKPASGRHERLRHLYPDARAVVYGHTHRAVHDRSARPWILNPGAAGCARTFGGPSCLILEAGVSCWRVRMLRFPASRD